MIQPRRQSSLTSPRNRQKLPQPTVDTCAYRLTTTKAGDLAYCTLLQQISGLKDIERCSVGRDACNACCESFPPTVESWNPVIGSRVFDLADRAVSEGGLPGCTTRQAEVLRQKALAALDVSRPADQVIRPLRADRACCFLGPVLNREPDQVTAEAIHACRHPAHNVTSLEKCRLCRDWSSAPTMSRVMTPAELVPHPRKRSAAPARQWSVGVVTAPRREATLPWCLDSIIRAGWDRPHVFVDGLVRIPECHLDLPVTWREQAVGAWPNSYLALIEMIQRDPHADFYLLAQDDAFLYDRGNLREYLEAALWPEDCPGIASLFCPQPYNQTSPGWHVRPEPWIWGAQTFLFSRETAHQLVQSPQAFSHRWTGLDDGRAQVDVLIGRWAFDHGWPVWFPNPSLAQHVGNTSSIWQDTRIGGWRRADWFAGDLESPFACESAMSDFPEHLFPCRDDLRAEYQERIEVGRRRMSTRRAVFCGLCRDVRHFLPKFAARIERLGPFFRDYRVVLFENDSRDATLEFLHDWRAANDRVHVLTDRLGTVRYPQIRSSERAGHMAEYRNRYRDFAVAHFGEFDDLLVFDTDLAGGFSYDGLAHTYSFDDWDFVGSHGLLRYDGAEGWEWRLFDAWAFRAIGHPHPHSSSEVSMTLFDRGEPMLPVLSCFGGLGVYRMAAMKSARYGSPDQEHCELHSRMRERGFGRMFLNPSQIALYSPE